MLRAPPALGHAHFSYGCDFMMDLGKPKLYTKFEVPSFCHCINIEGNPQFCGATLAHGHVHPFFCVWFYDGP